MALSWRNDTTRYKRLFLNIRAMYNQRPDLRIFLEILLSLATIGLFAAFALRPTLLTISQLLKDIEAKENTVKQLNQKLANLKQAQANYQQIQGTLPLIEFAVPNSPSPEVLIRQLEGVANKNAVSLTSASVGEVVLLGTQKAARQDNNLTTLPANALGFPIAISVTGDYQALIGFLRDVENLRRLVVVDSVSFNSATTDSGLKIVLTITGRGLYEKQN